MADSIEEVIQDYLTDDAVYNAKFSGIWHIEAPEGSAYPYVVIHQIDDPGDKRRLNKKRQGMARIQCDVWDNNRIRGTRLRTETKEILEDLNVTTGGYNVVCVGTNEVTVPRPDVQEPYHFVVDAVIQWNK